MNADQPVLPTRQPGAHLPTRYRSGDSAWPGQRGVIPEVRWAESVPYSLLARVRESLPRA